MYYQDQLIQWEYIIFLPTQAHMCAFFAFLSTYRVIFVPFKFFLASLKFNLYFTTGDLVFLLFENYEF